MWPPKVVFFEHCVAGRVEAAPQERQPGVLARERILASTRYGTDKEAVGRCIATLGEQAEVVVAAAAEEQLQKKKDKEARKEAARQARKDSDAKAAAGGAAAAGEEDDAEKKKKKRKKKVKVEAVVLDTQKPFVPHDARMAALLGHS